MPLITCPECESAMKAVPRGEIVIDICPSCRGVWLDGGELEKLLAETRQHEKQRLKDEALAEGRDPTSRSKSSTADSGSRKEKKKRRKKKGLFDLGDLGDLVGDFFD